jgi:DNA polymerase-1
VVKTLTGEELQLDEAPAQGSELFLVDGNNLAYRAFFALPEELQTTEGQPTNALLGFTNMLFKLLADYRPRGVAVAWDTRPVHRAEISAEYKSERRAMPDLLREQFPHFRPIVEAFGYVNLEFEGWEADDVIATLATQADEAGIKTCVVSTDRDAFQLVTENVCLMMTPRGVADVHVYTPERVEARYGIRPDQVPDFIGLKGDTGRSSRCSSTRASSPRRARARSPRTRSRLVRRSCWRRCAATSSSASTRATSSRGRPTARS